MLQAGGCRDPRHGTRRRARGCALLPLSRRGSDSEARHAGGQAWPPARRRGHATAAARRRCAQGPGDVRDGKSDLGERRVRLRARRPARRGRADPARGRLCRGSSRHSPAAQSSERQDKLDECDPAMFDAFRKENARKFRGFDAPEATSRRSRSRARSPTPRASRRAQTVHGADGRRPSPRRSNISSSPSARPTRSKACRKTPSRGRSARSG